MKTIVRNENNVSLYLFDDNENIDIQENKTIIGNPAKLIISDCNASNCTLFENVVSPADWINWKYLYTAQGGWSLNPNWTPVEKL